MPTVVPECKVSTLNSGTGTVTLLQHGSLKKTCVHINISTLCVPHSGTFPSVNAVKEIVRTLPTKLGTLENKTIPIQSWGVSGR